MGSGAAEGGRTGPESVSFTNRLLNTHITALSTKENFVFVGECCAMRCIHFFLLL